ncbi:hypothetical protein ACHAW5_008807 [Stephanodiscus triporus]|uniref:4Fe-4S ferredoxin-type domain-containing protein n=1 Tax=Stephanodiscus triporus TaxID=2934178 RepID=A0ABD3NSL7_9STRA
MRARSCVPMLSNPIDREEDCNHCGGCEGLSPLVSSLRPSLLIGYPRTELVDAAVEAPLPQSSGHVVRVGDDRID